MPDSDLFPNWSDDFGALTSYIVQAHGYASNIPQASSVGSSVHIGIIDSACELPPEITEGHNVNQGQSNSFIETEKKDTTNHAEDVFSLTSSYCPGAEFSIYQSVKENNSLPLTAYSESITAAIDDGVDILNISAGDPWRGPTAANPNVSETKRAIQEDIIVVAAAGNWKQNQDRRPPVHCPAALQDVIAVGGFVTDCPAEMGDEPSHEKVGPYYIEHESGYEYSESIPERPFCGRNGCVNGKGCISNSVERPWEGNVLPTGGKPDVLAPIHVPTYNKHGKPILNCGSSFAAPIVTGSLATILDELRRSEDRDLNAYQAREAVINGSTPIDEGKIDKYDAIGTRKNLGLY